ncbi:hypothetical protein [Streptomyces sp. NPDC020917]|uniref:hypothetical protein n=1 Tax=Streptomyces sp. NPDC020917 TaxID=3365102 RepID=UPI0037B35D58
MAAAVVATSLVWGAVLVAVVHGRTHVLDLHGYRIPDSTCTAAHLEPFTEALGLEQFDADPGVVLRGQALDHVSCVLSGTRSAGDGWTTEYTATVTVDLHKKADPQAEFEDAGRVQNSNLAVNGQGTYAAFPVSGVIRPVTGLGERAYSILSDKRQVIRALDGGAVFSLTFDGINQWQGTGTPPATGGAVLRPVSADTTFLRPALLPTMRQLMKSLSSASPE